MKNTSFTTAILRFRDLATPEGGTINRHKNEIKDHSSTWWGWWNKAGEKVPMNAFSVLEHKIIDGEENIYLFDSGQYKIYEGICDKIEWKRPEKKITSPDSEKTPDYYAKERECLAWFRFVQINEVENPKETLQKYTYYRVDDLFQEEGSRFEPFYDKRVVSPKELRYQERTVWFVRPYRSGDPEHELLTPEVDRFRPQHFTSEFRTLTGLSLLWVSDMHFSRQHHAFPIYEGEATPERATLAGRIRNDIISDHKISGVILSGDFTWKASRDEFLFAKNFVDNLRTWVASKSGQLVVCPGNHDLKWTKDPSNKQKKVDVAGEEARKEYVRFYRELFYQDPNDFMTMGRRLLLDRAFPVEIASLNSSFLQQEKEHFQGHGFTGENQRRQVAQKMDWESENKNPRTIRIVVVHHDVLPTSFTDRLQKEAPYSLMLDAEGLLQWATELRVDVILHGHKHQPAYNALRRPHPIGDTHTIHVVGMGSAGVKSDHLAEIRQNVVGVLTFEENQLRCDTFFVRPNAPAEKSDSHSYLLSLSTL